LNDSISVSYSTVSDSENTIGTVPWINYDGIENTLEQTQYHFCEGMQQPNRIISALRSAAYLDELLSAIIQDFRCWMFFSPNMYGPVSSLFKVSESLNGGIDGRCHPTK
jgi:hypothetical protein